ncbi:hypothetical protein CDO73_26260 [Saccharibacillus sp. O23]|nr:hypothetical protein CDO73_26260 [Saccharibacillus sp. O23]
MTYRYYRHGGTSRALKCVKRLIDKGRLKTGEIVTIRGSFTQERWYRLTIRTETEQFQFDGFAWFYGGEGPRGVQQVLKWLLVPGEIIETMTDVKHQGDTFTPNCFFIR